VGWKLIQVLVLSGTWIVACEFLRHERVDATQELQEALELARRWGPFTGQVLNGLFERCSQELEIALHLQRAVIVFLVSCSRPRNAWQTGCPETGGSTRKPEGARRFA